MPASMIQFVRHTPVAILQDYFKDYSFANEIDWTNSNKDLIQSILGLVDTMNRYEREHLNFEVERIHMMTDEVGQSALDCTVADRNMFHKVKNVYHRSLWVFMYDNDNFKHAEEVRYSDNYFRDSIWDAFIGPKNINIDNKSEQILLFERKIKDFFKIEVNIKVEIFSRLRINDSGKETKIFQVMIHKDSLPNSYLTFEGEQVIARVIHIVEELIITYEPDTGQIYIVSKGNKRKKNIVKIFAQTFLQSSLGEIHVSIKRYTIEKLLKPYNFITSPKDGIKSVEVMLLNLKSLRSKNQVIIKRAEQEKKSIYEISQEFFKENDPLLGKFTLIGVRLLIRFYPSKANTRSKELLIEINYPNGCDLKNKTTKERLIIEHCFKTWKLVEEL